MTLVLILAILDSLFAAIENKVFQTDFVITMEAEASQPMNIPGTITMQGEQFVGELMGMEMAYDGANLYVWQQDDEELTITRPQKEELTDFNPLLYAQTLMQDSHVTQRDSKDGQSVYITLTPKDQTQGLQRFVLKLRKLDSMPLSVEMTENKKTTTLNLVNPHFIDTAPPFRLEKEGAYINDLR